MSARGSWFETQGRFFWILLHFLLMVTRPRYLGIHSHVRMISGIQQTNLSRHESLRTVMMSNGSGAPTPTF